METINLSQIGIVKNAILTPQDDNWGDVVSELVFDAAQLTEASLVGIEEFSHLEVIFLMHLVDPSNIPLGARHPRNLKHLPTIGILAQRPKARPNRLGLSRCELIRRDGLTLAVKGLDAINGSPILDVKPFFQEFAPRGTIRQPEWTREIMANYY
ncbi:SAM-dependent methyltransferase [Massilia sp. LMS1-1-1.1]